MVAVMDYLVFALAFAGATFAMVATLLPAMPRIVSLLSGRGDPAWAAEPLLLVSARRRSERMRSVAPSAQTPLREVA